MGREADTQELSFRRDSCAQDEFAGWASSALKKSDRHALECRFFSDFMTETAGQSRFSTGCVSYLSQVRIGEHVRLISDIAGSHRRYTRSNTGILLATVGHKQLP